MDLVFNKKAVLWDLDNTVYNRREAARQMFPGLFRACLYENPGEELLARMTDFIMEQIGDGSLTGEKAYRALLEHFPADKPYDHAQCTAYYYDNIRDFAKPYPETVEIIRVLKERGIRQAIVTNIVPELLEHQKKKVAALGISELFDAVIYSAEVGFHKPDRRIFEHAAAMLGVSVEECLFVGDDLKTDVQGALNAGMEVVWLDRWNRENPYRDHPRVHQVRTAYEYFRR